MEHSASRHLRRRQLYTTFMVQDLAHQAYTRAALLGKVRTRPNRDAIAIEFVDLDRTDNNSLATAALTIAQALDTVAATTETAKSATLRRMILRLVLRFGGEQLSPELLDNIFNESQGDQQ